MQVVSEQPTQRKLLIISGGRSLRCVVFALTLFPTLMPALTLFPTLMPALTLFPTLMPALTLFPALPLVVIAAFQEDLYIVRSRHFPYFHDFVHLTVQ